MSGALYWLSLAPDVIDVDVAALVSSDVDNRKDPLSDLIDRCKTAATGAKVCGLSLVDTRGDQQNLSRVCVEPHIVLEDNLLAPDRDRTHRGRYKGLGNIVAAKNFRPDALGEFFAVPVLILVGAWLAWTFAGGFRPLLSTAYGWLLMTKLGVALLAMSAGALNKQFITGLIQRAPARGRFWLSVTLAIEASLFFLAIALVTLATTAFPRTGI